MRDRVRLLLLVCGVAAALLASAASAEAYVYWASDGTSTVGRADFDGTGVTPGFIPDADEGQGVAVSSTYVYYEDRFGMDTSIGRATIAGGSPQKDFIPLGQIAPRQVAVDGTYVYWTTQNGIGRATLNGAVVELNWLPLTPAPIGIAVNATKIFWSTSGTVRTADLNGSNVTTLLTDLGTVEGIDLDANHVWWTRSDAGGAISRAALDGSDPALNYIPSTGNGTVGIAVDGTHVYWSRRNGDLGRAFRDGHGVQATFLTGLNALAQLDVDAGGPPAVRTLTVTTSGSGSGFVSGSGIDCGGVGHTDCSEVISSGNTIELTANPDANSDFAGFSGGGCGATSPCTVTMDADKSLDAAFSEKPPTCQGVTATIVAVTGQRTVGTAAPDVIVGTDGDDDIRARGGDDLVCALDGDDEVRAYEGEDGLYGGAGADLILGNQDADTISGGAGADELRGRRGADSLSGGGADDEIFGGLADDSLDGGGGHNTLNGGAGTNQCVNGPVLLNC